MFTKLAVVSIFCVAFAAKDTRKPLDFIEFAKPCAEELELQESNIGDFTTKDKLIEVVLGLKELDHNGKCLLKCMSEKEGYMVNGQIDVDMMKENAPEGTTIDYTKCKSITDGDACEQAYKQSICITTQIKDVIKDD